MSYEIIYDKQFIRVAKDKFVPMVLAGSNNWTEFKNGRERRERSWWAWNISNKLVYSKEELLKFVEQTRERIIKQNEEYDKDSGWYEEYSDKKFGYWSSLAISGNSTRTTTFGQFKGIFETGCKKALTIEELKECFVSVYVENAYYPNNEREKLKIEPYSKTVNSGEELLQAIEEFNEIFKGTEQRPSVRFSGMYDDTPKFIRLKFFKKEVKPRSEKQAIEVEKYFTIVAPNNYYFVKRIKYGYKYSAYPYQKFLTEQEAKRKLRTLGEGYKIEEVNEKQTFYR